jgi:phosphoribosylaminoimidazole (AIR) synthetase
MIPIIYYAHSMTIYGSDRENAELELLQKHFRDGLIYNPNRAYIETHKTPMKACFDVVADSAITGLAFSTNQGHYVSLGVFAEIRCAQKRNKQIFRIHEDRIEVYPKKLTLVKRNKKTQWARC